MPSNVTCSPRRSRATISTHSSNRLTLRSVGKAEGLVLGVVPAGSDTERQAAVRDQVERRGHVRDEAGVAKRRAEDERRDLDTLGDGGEGAHQRPRLVHALRLPLGRLVEEVIREPDGVEALRLGRLGKLAQRRPAGDPPVAFVHRQHDPDLHRAQSTGGPGYAPPMASTRKPPFKLSARTRVGFSDTDAQGIVYYGRYNPYFDLARVEYLRRLELLQRRDGRGVRDARERGRVLRARGLRRRDRGVLPGCEDRAHEHDVRVRRLPRARRRAHGHGHADARPRRSRPGGARRRSQPGSGSGSPRSRKTTSTSDPSDGFPRFSDDAPAGMRIGGADPSNG